jgi:hypothetical protein
MRYNKQNEEKYQTQDSHEKLKFMSELLTEESLKHASRPSQALDFSPSAKKLLETVLKIDNQLSVP